MRRAAVLALCARACALDPLTRIRKDFLALTVRASPRHLMRRPPRLDAAAAESWIGRGGEANVSTHLAARPGAGSDAVGRRTSRLISRRRVAATPRAGSSVAVRGRARGVAGPRTEKGRLECAAIMKDIRNQTNNGVFVVDAFAAAARSYSDDAETAADGGELGKLINQGVIRSRELDRACFTATLGEVEGPVESEYVRRAVCLRRIAAPPRPRRGWSVGDESRRRRGRDADGPWETSRGAAAAATRIFRRDMWCQVRLALGPDARAHQLLQGQRLRPH